MVKIICAESFLHSLESVVGEIWRDEGTFFRQILLVPDRFTFEAEKMLLKEREGALGIDVLTFRRLALSLDKGERRELTKQGAAAALALIIRENASELGVFGTSSGKKGFASEILDVITQLKSSGILPHNMKNLGEGVGALSEQKLSDIKIIYSAYEEFLKSSRLLDQGDLLFNLKNYFLRADLSSTAFYMSNYLSLTKQTLDIVEVLGKRAGKLVFAVPLSEASYSQINIGTKSISLNQEINIINQSASIQEKINQSANIQNEINQSASVQEKINPQEISQKEINPQDINQNINTNLNLNKNQLSISLPPLDKFDSDEEYEPITQRLFNEIRALFPKADIESGKHLPDVFSALYSNTAISGSPVIFEADNLIKEIIFIARDIRRRIQGGGIRYRDIGVCINSPCFDVIERVFGAFDIPYYGEKKLVLYNHPQVNLLCALLSARARGLKAEIFIRAMKNAFMFLSSAEADAAENLILETRAEYGDFFELGKINRAIFKTLRLFRVFDDVPTNAVEFSSCIYRALEIINEYRQEAEADLLCISLANDRANGAFKASRESLASLDKYGKRVEEGIRQVLEQLSKVCGSAYLTLNELTECFENALMNLSIALIPQGNDCVYVGGARMFLSTGKRVLYVAEMNEGKNPIVKDDLGIFSDRDLGRFKRVLNLNVTPLIRAVNREERDALLWAIKESEEVCFSYSLNDLGGRALSPSHLLYALKGAFSAPKLVSYRAEEIRAYESAEREDYLEREESLGAFVGSIFSAKNYLLKAAGAYEQRKLKRFPYLARLLVNIFSNEDISLASVEGLNGGEIEDKKIIRGIGEGFFKGGVFRTSATNLEDYFSCPYKYFIKHAVGFNRRLGEGGEALDIGSFLHRFVEVFTRRGLKFDEWMDVFDYVLRDFPYLTKKNDLLNKLLVGEAEYIARELAQENANSEFKVVGVEVPFGFQGELDAIEFFSINGVRVWLSGRMDRVDRAGEFVRVIDFKTGKSVSLDAGEVYGGQKLQPFVYLYALMQAGYKPLGTFYLKLGGGAYGGEGLKFLGAYVHSEEAAALFDKGLAAGEKSRYFSFERNKDGALRAQGRARFALSSTYELEYLCNRAVKTIKVAADEILDGYLKANPAVGACKFCDLTGVCYYGESGLGYRKVREPKKEN